MRNTDSPRGKLPKPVFFLTALLVVAADQLSKLWITSELTIGESLPEAGVFRLTHVQNTGAAFGLFPGQSVALIIVGLLGIIALLAYVLFYHRRFPLLDNRLAVPALGLV